LNEQGSPFGGPFLYDGLRHMTFGVMVSS